MNKLLLAAPLLLLSSSASAHGLTNEVIFIFFLLLFIFFCFLLTSMAISVTKASKTLKLKSILTVTLGHFAIFGLMILGGSTSSSSLLYACSAGIFAVLILQNVKVYKILHSEPKTETIISTS